MLRNKRHIDQLIDLRPISIFLFIHCTVTSIELRQLMVNVLNKHLFRVRLVTLKCQSTNQVHFPPKTEFLDGQCRNNDGISFIATQNGIIY